MDLLAWALWLTVETHTIPAKGQPHVDTDVVARFATYEKCDAAARWAESQPDMREDFLVYNGKKYRAVMSYDCRKEN